MCVLILMFQELGIDHQSVCEWTAPIRRRLEEADRIGASGPKLRTTANMVIMGIISKGGVIVDSACIEKEFDRQQWKKDKTLITFENLSHTIRTWPLDDTVPGRTQIACSRCRKRVIKMMAIPCGHPFCWSCAKEQLQQIRYQRVCAVCGHKLLAFNKMYYY